MTTRVPARFTRRPSSTGTGSDPVAAALTVAPAGDNNDFVVTAKQGAVPTATIWT